MSRVAKVGLGPRGKRKRETNEFIALAEGSINLKSFHLNTVKGSSSTIPWVEAPTPFSTPEGNMSTIVKGSVGRACASPVFPWESEAFSLNYLG